VRKGVFFLCVCVPPVAQHIVEHKTNGTGYNSKHVRPHYFDLSATILEADMVCVGEQDAYPYSGFACSDVLFWHDVIFILQMTHPHGLLGQTTRFAKPVVTDLKRDTEGQVCYSYAIGGVWVGGGVGDVSGMAQGVIEGTVNDYRVHDLLNVHFKYGQFQQ